MIELAWFSAGAAVVGLAIASTRLRRGRRRQAREPVPVRPQRMSVTATPASVAQPTPKQERPAPDPSATQVEVQRVALAISQELASLVSGVDGAAHDLIERAPEPEYLPRAAEQLLTAVQRLRTLHQKLEAYGGGRAATTGTASVVEVVDTLTDELQRLRLGLELEVRFASALPMVALPAETLRNVLLFACGAMFRSENGATHLSITAEPSLGDDDSALRVELLLEWPGDPGRTPGRTTHDPRVAIALDAAARLARSHGAEVTLSYPPGRAVKTLVVLPAAEDAPVVEVPEPVVEIGPPPLAPTRHRFGGALVVEADPAVRSMLARELRSAGRAVFACADGAAARTFLEATPDRFELLIVDHHERLDERDELGRAVRRLAPRLRICVLTPCTPHCREDWPGIRCIEKPFGVHELRHALASVLQTG